MKKELIKDLHKETEKRVKRMKIEFKKKLAIKVFENCEKYDQIIAQIKIPFSSICPHHKVAFFGYASIGYIPDKWLVGLSKLGRTVEKFLNPTLPILQEEATHKIMLYLKKELNPKGLIVVIKAEHTCIGYRGVKKPSQTITSAVDGIFKTQSSTKEEFLTLLQL